MPYDRFLFSNVLTLLFAVTLIAGAPRDASARGGAEGAPSTGFGLGAVKIPDAVKGVEKTTGLRFGRSVFHAGVDLEGGWDSNAFYSPNNPQSSGFLRIMPNLSLGTASGKGKKPSVVYDLNLGLDYTAYLNDIGTGGKDRHLIGASAGGSVLFNPSGVFRFQLVEQYVRTNEPRAGVEFGYNRSYNAAGFDMTINPGLGLITILTGYRFIIDFFEEDRLDFANAMRHHAKVKVDWRFFPLTTMWLKVETGYDHYNWNSSFDAANLATSNRSSVPLLVMLGATGRLTPKLTVDLGIGYRGHFFTDELPDAENDHHDVAANVGLKWEIAPTAGLALGYQHDSRDSVVGDLYKADSAYLALNLAFFERLVLAAKVGWTMARFEGYRAAVEVNGNTCASAAGCARTDNYLLVGAHASYYFLSWLSVGLGYDLLANFSDFDYTLPGTTDTIEAGFVKHRVYGQLSLYY